MFGAAAFLSLDARLRFGVEVAVMLGFAAVLYRLLFGRESRDLFRLVLAGIIAGTVCFSLTALLTRLIDPNEFMTLQDLLFADFSAVSQDLLLIAAGVGGRRRCLLVRFGGGWTRRHWGANPPLA